MKTKFIMRKKILVLTTTSVVALQTAIMGYSSEAKATFFRDIMMGKGLTRQQADYVTHQVRDPQVLEQRQQAIRAVNKTTSGGGEKPAESIVQNPHQKVDNILNKQQEKEGVEPLLKRHGFNPSAPEHMAAGNYLFGVLNMKTFTKGQMDAVLAFYNQNLTNPSQTVLNAWIGADAQARAVIVAQALTDAMNAAFTAVHLQPSQQNEANWKAANSQGRLAIVTQALTDAMNAVFSAVHIQASQQEQDAWRAANSQGRLGVVAQALTNAMNAAFSAVYIQPSQQEQDDWKVANSQGRLGVVDQALADAVSAAFSTVHIQPSQKEQDDWKAANSQGRPGVVDQALTDALNAAFTAVHLQPSQQEQDDWKAANAQERVDLVVKLFLTQQLNPFKPIDALLDLYKEVDDDLKAYFAPAYKKLVQAGNINITKDQIRDQATQDKQAGVK